MLNKLKLIPFMVAAALGLQACGDDDPRTADAPRQLINVNSTVYSAIRENPTANALFVNTGAANAGDELCDVKVHRMQYNTVGGAGEAATSSGVFMLPHGDDPACSGERPVVLYAHGTSDEKNYDLSQFSIDPTNAAAGEATILLAVYASRGYAVIAPNYAGYSDSSLNYHPYLDEVQQSTEMINALDHVKEHADTLGANLSSELFVTGTSQGGYVAMATHKALEASGQKVAASMPVSGPYAMIDFIDAVFAGAVNGGATIFAPLALTALDKSVDIYDDPGEVYAPAHAGTAENSLPTVGGFAATTLPAALFKGPAPEGAPNPAGFGDDFLLAESFRGAYLADLQANPDMPANAFRTAIKALDLRNWNPSAPVLLCGTNNDPVVYYNNTTSMAEFWSTEASAGLVNVLDLNATPAGPFAQAQGGFQAQGFPLSAVHAQTGPFCALAGKNYFDSIRALAASSAAN